ncbi:DNA cytosine methyltransferase [Corynebacterium accolens]|uniref:DNA cytosine methyltransferase n=1 Tax=Corynebacterium accolens TaxID=38284 RepID=UPI0025433428|nr:DNA cytosine methyltransferase [Corynebacterium accolens]MDK4333528.1 DNA cytosine methyltransferase [Corynebacterium accolens]
MNRYLRDNNLVEAPQDHPRTSNGLADVVGLSFFSGAGGLDLGLEIEGITSLLYCENNRESRMTISMNRPESGLLGDISKVTAEQVRAFARIPDGREVDVMFGGPPCQAFSTAGARRAFDDERGNVFLTYLDLANELQPKYLVIENVRGLLSTPFPLVRGGEPVKGGAMRMVLSRLEGMGYGVSFNLYNSANYGVPQIRERVILIAKRSGGIMPWLKPTHSEVSDWGLPPWKTFDEATSYLEGINHEYNQFPAKRLKYFSMLKEGEYWTSLPKEVQPAAMGKAYELSGGRTGFYRRLNGKRPAPTLVTSPTMPATDLCHPRELRPLSVQEYKAIQGFPLEWKIAGKTSDIYRQVGNAVPVELGRAIGRSIMADMEGKLVEDEKFIAFPYSRYRTTNQRVWSER